jgi:hypothetical protein
MKKMGILVLIYVVGGSGGEYLVSAGSGLADRLAFRITQQWLAPGREGAFMRGEPTDLFPVAIRHNPDCMPSGRASTAIAIHRI